MTHYDTLGVSQNAIPAEIKRAFRQKASKLHPDRGGDDDEMADLNRAYEALINPERRKRYDETGSDAPEKPLDVKARELMMQAFMQVLTGVGHGDLAENSRALIRETLKELRGNIAASTARQEEFRKRREKMKCKDGNNLFHQVVDQQIELIGAGIEQLRQKEPVLERALEMLESYEGEATPPAVYFQMMGSTATGGGW